MNRTPTPPNRGAKQPIWKARSTAGAIAVVVLVAGYSLVAPAISRKIGIQLPTISADRDGSVRVGSSQQPPPSDATANSPTDSNLQLDRGESIDRGESSPSTDPAASQADDELLYGRLREISPDRYVSISGLLYTPGSAEGHRLEHLRRHTRDQPGRAGSHGVFDGDMSDAIETVDLAYERAKKGQRTTKSTDQGRTIYTVDMGKRVGYVGGRTGNQRRKPMARRVRLVLEGNRLITAYPL